MSTPLFHPLRVRAVEPDTAEAVIVSFEVPTELRQTFGFIQGQYLTLRQQIDGQDLRRSYSICAGVDDGDLRVGVRKVRGGLFSNWINAQLRPGDIVNVMAPQGRFHVPLEPAAQRHHVGFAGGSGITPILSIMKTVLAREPHSRFTLVYGNRSLKSTMFKEEIEDLKNRYMTRLVLLHVFSEEQTDSPLNMGLMNRDKIAELLAGVLPVGGIKDKVLAAMRGGIKKIILPVRNKKDLRDIPEQARAGVEFVFATRMDDVLEAALEVPPSTRTGGVAAASA